MQLLVRNSSIRANQSNSQQVKTAFFMQPYNTTRLTPRTPLMTPHNSCQDNLSSQKLTQWSTEEAAPTSNDKLLGWHPLPSGCLGCLWVSALTLPCHLQHPTTRFSTGRRVLRYSAPGEHVADRCWKSVHKHMLRCTSCWQQQRWVGFCDLNRD